jgi:hypothetical protein
MLRQLFIGVDLFRNFFTYAHLAVLNIENGTVVCFFDSNFARFNSFYGISSHSQ